MAAMQKQAGKSAGKGKVIPISTAGGNGAKPSVRMAIPIKKLKPNPDQVRRSWDTTKDEEGKSSLDRLAESIRNQGLLSDLVVTPQNGQYLIVCGERRFRAIRNHKLMEEVPCIVREGLTPAQLLELNIIENLQREDLTPIDEAEAYKALMEKCGYTQGALAKKLGLSGAMVSYKLSLLNLTPGLQKQVAKGRLSETDGRAIAQAVKRINGPQARQQQAQAMANIEKEIEKEPANPKTKKVDTPVVKRVAESAVTQVAGSKALPRLRAPKRLAPKAAPVPLKKSAKKIRECAEHFIIALKDVNEILRPMRRDLADKKLRNQVIKHLLAQYPNLPHKIRAALSPLDLIYKEAAEQLDKNALGKKGAKTKKQAKKPARKTVKKTLRKQKTTKNAGKKKAARRK